MVTRCPQPHVCEFPQPDKCAAKPKRRADIDIEVPDCITGRLQYVSAADFIFGILVLLQPDVAGKPAILLRRETLGADPKAVLDHLCRSRKLRYQWIVVIHAPDEHRR